MSQLTDEQIQRLIEAGESLPGKGSVQQAAEAGLYQQLFNELKKELPLQPSVGFSARVMARIERLEPASSQSGIDHEVWAGVGLGLLLVIAAILSIGWLMPELVNVLTILKPIQGGIVFGVLSLLLVQWLDFKLIREPSLPPLG